MPDIVEDLEPQADASASSDAEVRFADDKSVNTAVDNDPKPVVVETKADDEPKEPKSEVDSSPAEVEVLDEKADSEPVPDSLQDRMDKVTALRRESERTVTARDQEIAQLRKQLADIPVKAEPFKALADFDYDNDKFQSYMASEIQSRSTAAAERAVSERDSKTGTEQVRAEFAEREKAFAATVKDYDEIVHDRNLPISEPMARVLEAVDDGPELGYYLGNNPEVARRISALPPEAVGFELSNIQHTLNAEKAKAAKANVTKAPAPVPKLVKGSDTLEKDPADMSDKEFAKMRRKQIANR
jgi:hypothetical protein